MPFQSYPLDFKAGMANHGQSMAILDRNSPGQPDFFSSQVMSARRFFRPDAAEAAAPPASPGGTEETEDTGAKGAECPEGTE